MSGVIVEVRRGKQVVELRKRGVALCPGGKVGHFGFQLPRGCALGCCERFRCFKHGIWKLRRHGFPSRHT